MEEGKVWFPKKDQIWLILGLLLTTNKNIGVVAVVLILE